jgi:hypothetical protein
VAILGSSPLLEVEINAGLEVFKLLEPEVQKGFIALFHLLHHQRKVPNPAGEDLSSTS